jgi:hypothetical protein
VIHDVGLSHFRMKMDAVPGIPTTLWFTPKYTTKEMKERTKNPNFVYEISCDQMCGNSHYSMRGNYRSGGPGRIRCMDGQTKTAVYLAFILNWILGKKTDSGH